MWHIASRASRTVVTSHQILTRAFCARPQDVQSMIPRRIVSELDRHIVGQQDAKRAVAVALRNRWRRHKLPEEMKDEVIPKNILMIGPTGVGKTEIVRRMSKLIDAPFIKVEATKFTEVGFHGRDVDQIIRDLLDYAIIQTKEKLKQKSLPSIKEAVNRRIVQLLCGESSGPTFNQFLELLKEGALEDRPIEVPRTEPKRSIPVGAVIASGSNQIDLGEVFASILGPRGGSGSASGSGDRTRQLPIKEARPILEEDEAQKFLASHNVIQEAIRAVEEDGIVFIDEIDKICANERSYGSGASDEGVQKDLLPLIEGCSISTKHGDVNTSHILFIASGAFMSVKPSDLLAELQGRLPIRVELTPLSNEDLYRILTEPQHNLIAQQQALMKSEGIALEWTDEAVREIASVAHEVNEEVENIGARRLHTIVERVIEDLSFNAPEYEATETTPEGLKRVVIDKQYVRDKVDKLLKKSDLRRFIL